MSRESLEDHLRKTTRHFSARLPEEQVLTLGRDLARELARAHAEAPPRHPEIEPATIAFVDGKPVLEGGEGAGDVTEDLLQLGALLQSLATAVAADVSWRLDGPPTSDLSSLERRAALAGLTSLRPETRYASAAAAADALEAALAPAAGAAPPWPLFRGDAARTGFRPSPGPVTALVPVWDAPLGPVIASPVLTARLVIAASADGRLHFLERGTGRRLHEAKVASALESSPALAGDVLHLGTDDGEVVVNDGRVLVGVMDTKDAGALVAVDATKGKLLWRRKLGAVFSSPTLAGARVLVGSDDGALHAIEPERGTVTWSHRLGGRVRATAAVSGEVAVVSDFEGRLAAVRLQDGGRLWLRELGQPVYSSAGLSAGLVVVGCHDGSVQGLSLASGEPRFRVETRGPVVSSPVAMGDRFLAASTDGDLYLLDARGQVLLRTTVAREGLQSSPAFDETLLVLGSARGLHAFKLVR